MPVLHRFSITQTVADPYSQLSRMIAEQVRLA